MAELLDFINTPPSSGQVQLLIQDPDQIVGMTIPILSKNGENLKTRLKKATGIRFKYNGYIHTADIIDKVNKTTYFYLGISSTYTSYTGLDTDSHFYLLPESLNTSVYGDLLPSYQVVDVIRKSSILKDVDRVQGQKNPLNYAAIVANTADNAIVQDSNYSDTGMVRSRYSGVKITNENKSLQGNDPSLSLTSFVGSIYEATADSTSICPLVLSNETTKDEILYFNRKPRIFPGNCKRYNVESIFSDRSGRSFTYIDCSGDTVTVTVDVIGYSVFFNGDTNINITSITASYIPKQTILKEIRLTEIDISTLPELDQDDVNEVLSFPVTGSTIFQVVGRDVIRAVNKRVWIKQLNVIRNTDKDGRINYSSESTDDIHARGFSCPTLQL